MEQHFWESETLEQYLRLNISNMKYEFRYIVYV